MAKRPRGVKSVPLGVSGVGQDVLDFEALMVSMPVPLLVYVLDDAETIRFVSNAYSQAFGYTLEDIPDLQVLAELTLPDPADRANVMHRWRASVDERRASDRIAPPTEVRICDKFGLKRDVLIGFSIHADYVMVAVQDITAMREAEAALAAEREITAHSLSENMPAGAYTMIQRDGEKTPTFAFVSRKFRSMLDLGEAPLPQNLGLWLSRVHPEDHGRWAAMADADTDRTKPFSFECRLLVKGMTRWVRAEAAPRSLPDGSTLWEGILIDVTALKETEQRLNRVIQASQAMTWSLDLQTWLLHVDSTWTAAHGYPSTKKSIAWSDWLQELHPDDMTRYLSAFDKLRSGDVSLQTSEHRRRHADGQWHWMRVHGGVSARDDQGRPITLSGVSFDVTAEKTVQLRDLEEKSLLREDLQRAQQRDTVAQIAGNVAHDLNNLISVISGTVEMLVVQNAGRPDAMMGIERIRRSVTMAQDLVFGLGGLVRPDQPRSLHDLGTILTDGAEMLGSRRMARHAIHIDVPKNPPVVWGNKTELSQVVVNLGINACDSGTSTDVATVRLAAEPAGTALPQRYPDVGGPIRPEVPMAVFTISDTGTGISNEVRGRMFRPHFTTKGSAGTGLGLAIVSSIVLDNHAALWVDSSFGKGTVVTVAWPAEKPFAEGRHFGALRPSEPDCDTGAAMPALDGMHVLVVDDVSDVGMVLADMLEAAGAVAFSETDPKEAQLVLAEAPDLWSVLVTDLHMPGIDGRALARFAANLSPPIPTVLVTARAETLQAGETALFARVLSKPVSAEHLALAVRSAARARPA
jgi:PAS domain S-box-containing protein